MLENLHTFELKGVKDKFYENWKTKGIVVKEECIWEPEMEQKYLMSWVEAMNLTFSKSRITNERWECGS